MIEVSLKLILLSEDQPRCTLELLGIKPTNQSPVGYHVNVCGVEG